MTLHLLQFRPDMARLARWAHAERLLPRDGGDDLGYPLHAVLAAVFADLRPQPFALLTHPQRPATLLAYSVHDAPALREQAAAFALPEPAVAIGVETLAAKALPDRFAPGRRLGFSVRVRPTVRTDDDGDRTAVRERDAFLVAVTGTPPDGGPERADVYRDWLSCRLTDGGADVHGLSMTAFALSPVYRRDAARRLGRQMGPDATFSGTLTVRDPGLFAALLARGVGRHRAFGFGMLLLRPE